MRGGPSRRTTSGSVPASSSTESASAAVSSRPRERSDDAVAARGRLSANPGAQRSVEPSIASGAPLAMRMRGRAVVADVAPPQSTTSRASESAGARNAGCARIARSTAAGQVGSTTVATGASEDVSTETVSSSASASVGEARASTLRTGARASNAIVAAGPGSIETCCAPMTPASVATTTRRDSARSPALVSCTWIASAVVSAGCGRTLNRATPTLRELSATWNTRDTGAAASQALTFASAPSVSSQCALYRSSCAGSGSRGSLRPACDVIARRPAGPGPTPASHGLLSALVSTSRTPEARSAVAARSSPRSSRVRPDCTVRMLSESSTQSVTRSPPRGSVGPASASERRRDAGSAIHGDPHACDGQPDRLEPRIAPEVEAATGCRLRMGPVRCRYQMTGTSSSPKSQAGVAKSITPSGVHEMIEQHALPGTATSQQRRRCRWMPRTAAAGAHAHRARGGQRTRPLDPAVVCCARIRRRRVPTGRGPAAEFPTACVERYSSTQRSRSAARDGLRSAGPRKSLHDEGGGGAPQAAWAGGKIRARPSKPGAARAAREPRLGSAALRAPADPRRPRRTRMRRSRRDGRFPAARIPSPRSPGRRRAISRSRNRHRRAGVEQQGPVAGRLGLEAPQHRPLSARGLAPVDVAHLVAGRVVAMVQVLQARAGPARHGARPSRGASDVLPAAARPPVRTSAARPGSAARRRFRAGAAIPRPVEQHGCRRRSLQFAFQAQQHAVAQHRQRHRGQVVHVQVRAAGQHGAHARGAQQRLQCARAGAVADVLARRRIVPRRSQGCVASTRSTAACLQRPRPARATERRDLRHLGRVEHGWQAVGGLGVQRNVQQRAQRRAPGRARSA